MRPRIDVESLDCLCALPNPKLSSSVDIGWSSLLINHVSGEGRSDLFETHATSDVTIVVATRGEHEIDVFSEGRWRHAIQQPGAVAMTKPFGTTRMRWNVRHPTQSFASAQLYIPAAFFEEAAEQLRRAGHKCREHYGSALVFNDSVIAAAVRGLLRAQAVGAPDLYAQQVGQWLAVHLLCLSPASIDDGDDRHPGLLSDRRLARSLEYMSAHFGDELTMDRLAAEAGISKFHFARIFKQKVGASPHAHLTNIRMATARRLIATTNLTLSQIAAECGYTQPSAFAAAFNRRFGCSPTQLRARSRGHEHIEPTLETMMSPPC